MSIRSDPSHHYLAFLQLKARVGIEIDVVDSDASGQMPQWTELSTRARFRVSGPERGF